MTIVASAKVAYPFGRETIYVSLHFLYYQWIKASKAFELDRKLRFY